MPETKKMLSKLAEIQQELKAPKGQFNSYGKYNYRSCEDILEAVKPLTTSRNLVLTVSDEIVFIERRFYVKAVAKLIDAETAESICKAFNRINIVRAQWYCCKSYNT